MTITTERPIVTATPQAGDIVKITNPICDPRFKVLARVVGANGITNRINVEMLEGFYKDQRATFRADHYELQSFTVEDTDALDTLPVGIKFIDRDGDTGIKTQNGFEGTWQSDRSVYRAGETINALASRFSFPVVITNPELLDLASYQSVVEPQFKAGDKVRIVGAHAATEFIGLEATVVEDAGTSQTRITPLTPRPDGLGVNAFYWGTAHLEAVVETEPARPFAIGTRVRITDNYLGFMGGSVGVVTGYADADDDGDTVYVLLDGVNILPWLDGAGAFRYRHVEAIPEVVAEPEPVKVGDFVKVVNGRHYNEGKIGTITYIHNDGSVNFKTEGASYVEAEDSIKAFMKIDKPEPLIAVGDILKLGERLNSLPNHSVIIQHGYERSEPFVKRGDTWMSAGSSMDWSPYMGNRDMRVLHVAQEDIFN